MLPRDGVISQVNRQAIRDVTRRGIAVILATGRIPAETVGYYDQLALSTPLVCYHGALVLSGRPRRDGDDSPTDAARLPHLLDAPIPADLLAEVVDFLFAARPDAQLMLGTSTRYFMNRIGDLVRYWDMSGPSRPEEAAIADVLHHRVYKLCCFCPDESQVPGIIDLVRNRFGDALAPHQGHTHLAEFVAPGASKVAGVGAALAALGLDWSDTLAIGDFYTDIEMIRRARLGLAVANAPEAVRAAAHAVTDACDRNGVAAALRQYL